MRGVRDLCTHDPFPHHLDRALCPLSHRDGIRYDLDDGPFEQDVADAIEAIESDGR
jgi:hypothetical protein